jgi:hypothetical protein
MDNLCDPKKKIKKKTYLAVIRKKKIISQHNGYNIISAHNIQGYVE